MRLRRVQPVTVSGLGTTWQVSRVQVFGTYIIGKETKTARLTLASLGVLLVDVVHLGGHVDGGEEEGVAVGGGEGLVRSEKDLGRVVVRVAEGMQHREELCERLRS